jgi:hypothetical protein
MAGELSCDVLGPRDATNRRVNCRWRNEVSAYATLGG